MLATTAGCSAAHRSPGAALSAPPSTASGAATGGATASGAPPTGSTTAPGPGGTCTILPADNVWHADVSRLPVHASSAAYIASIGASAPGHADFGSGLIDGAPFGIPVTTIPAGQARVPMSFEYADESDPGPYPVPRNALIEGGPDATDDRHVILYDPAGCRLYELYDAHPRADGSWHAGSGAIYDLRANRLRPAGWTSADEAGLPILPGLVRYDEVAAGHIDHAIRVTAPAVRSSYIWPARHPGHGGTGANLPPNGLRLRLKSTVDVSRMPAQARVVAEALKRYGAILADTGSSWFFTGTQDERWNNDALRALANLHGSDFEAVDSSGLVVDPNSAAVRP